MRVWMLAFLIVFCLAPAARGAVEFEETKSRHFIVYHEEGVGRDFVEATIEFAERYYGELTEKLGFVRYDYWTWDDRAKIYIYADQGSYMEDTGQPAWSGGLAAYHEKTIRVFPRGAGFFDALLPHELGHIVFHEVIGSHVVPTWLDEGVACYLEPARRFGSQKMALDAIEDGTFIPLKELHEMDPRELADDDQVELFYAESVSLLTFIVETFGIDRFNAVCDKIKEGRTFERAVKSCLFGVQDLEDLARMWEDSLKKKDSPTRRTML